MTSADLPKPDSEELKAVLRGAEQQIIYRLLYQRRGDPPTMTQIETFYAEQTGEAHAQTGRRVRAMYGVFNARPELRDGRWVYPLRGWAEERSRHQRGNTGISARTRGEVLSSKRCAQCGKTPSEDHVKLEVDHKVPQSWGGTNEVENLQPLCRQCNHDKQAFYTSMDPYEDQIRVAAQHLEPHRRIGELLKAFYAADAEAPSQVVAAVACMHQYQEDWQRRMRELRHLGWEYTHRKRSRDGRVMTYYRLTSFTDWPKGSISAEIKRRKGRESL